MKLGDTELEKNNEKVACSALSGESPSEKETQAEAGKTQRNQPCVKRIQNIRMEGAARAKCQWPGGARRVLRNYKGQCDCSRVSEGTNTCVSTSVHNTHSQSTAPCLALPQTLEVHG